MTSMFPEYYAEYFSEREMTKKLEALGFQRTQLEIIIRYF